MNFMWSTLVGTCDWSVANSREKRGGYLSGSLWRSEMNETSNGFCWETLSLSINHSCWFLVAARFSDNKMLHERQVAIISDFQRTVEGGESGVKQMIMGAGKTTVVSPLLSMPLRWRELFFFDSTETDWNKPYVKTFQLHCISGCVLLHFLFKFVEFVDLPVAWWPGVSGYWLMEPAWWVWWCPPHCWNSVAGCWWQCSPPSSRNLKKGGGSVIKSWQTDVNACAYVIYLYDYTCILYILIYTHTVYTHLQISMIPKWHKMMAGVYKFNPRGWPHRSFEEACLLVPLRPLRRCGYCHLWSHRVSEEWRRRFCREQTCKGFQHPKPVGPSDVPVAILAIWESVAELSRACLCQVTFCWQSRPMWRVSFCASWKTWTFAMTAGNVKLRVGT